MTRQNLVETCFLNVFFFLARDFFFIFFSWLLFYFKVHYINTKIIFYFFNMGFEAIQYIYSMFTRKKVMFFECRIKNLFDLNTST